MINVLLLNHSKEKCGLFQMLRRIYNILAWSSNINYSYKIVSNHEEYVTAVRETEPNFIIYNYHWDRMQWFKETDVLNNKLVKHLFIFHDGSMVKNYDKYLFFGAFDPLEKLVPANKRILLPRPLLDYTGDYKKNKIPTIGSFGFGFIHKNFPGVVKLVNDTFDEAVINIHMTVPFFGDLNNELVKESEKCIKANINPKIKLNIHTEFLDDDSLLEFLANNDINIFNYNSSEHKNPGISSAIDYALSVKRPIAVTNHPMFRHIISNEILLENNSIKSILERGTQPLEKYYTEWSLDNFKNNFDNIFLNWTE